jgi:regulator of protease activity HflC (stomatin/prohibitin superfamily)
MQSDHMPSTSTEHQRKCKSTVLKKNFHRYMKSALSTVVGAGSSEADEVIDEILTTVSNLEAASRGLNWQSDPCTLNGIAICIQMKYLSGEAEEELWAVSIDTLVRTKDGQLALPDGQVVKTPARSEIQHKELAAVSSQSLSTSVDCPDFLKNFRIAADEVVTHQLDAELGENSPIFSLSSPTSDLQGQLRPANATDGDIASIVRLINGGDNAAPVRSNPFGPVVPPGCIRLVDSNGRTFAAGPGRWILSQTRKFTGRARWVSNSHVNVTSSPVVTQGPLTICRVGPNEIGLAFENSNTPVLLGPGLHVYNIPSFRFVKTVDVKEDYVAHGTFHILQVQRGSYALVWESPTQPRILREGKHVVASPTFRFEKFIRLEEVYIKHGTIHIIQVPKGQLGKISENVTPKLLSDGVHMVDHPNFHFKGLEMLSSPVIRHGTITRFRVSQGEVGLATWQNEAVFVEIPGTYEVDSADFIYHEAKSVSSKLLQNGNKKVVTVFSGEVGLSYRAGCLDVLQPGRHDISAADHYFDSFISTKQVTLRLADTTHSSASDDLIVAETKDFVKVGICADIFYSIADAYKTVMRVGKDGVQTLVMETAIGTLTNIIRSTTLNEIAQSQHSEAPSLKKSEEDIRAAQATGQPSAPFFFDRAHDEFLARLHDNFLDRYGIEISNIRVASCKIMDKELSASISKQALVTAQTENQLANLKGQTEIATAEQDRQSRVAQIAAEQEARALQVATESQNKAQLEKSESDAKAKAFIVNQEAEALISRAKAEAEAIRLKAEAEAAGIRTKAKAEAERAELLSKTPLGSQLALLELWSRTVEKSNEGISKVVYCDPSVQMAAGGGNPLGLLGLGQLQGELSKLSKIGETASKP